MPAVRTFLAAPLVLASATALVVVWTHPARGEDAKTDAGASRAGSPNVPGSAAGSAHLHAATSNADAGTPSTPETKVASTSPSGPRVTITGDGGKTMSCREQAAQAFLIRGNWFPHTKDADQLKQGRKMLEDSLRYRTEKYGYFEGFGSAKWNAHPPKYYAKSTTFMGMSVQVHERIIPALKCVEAALKAGSAAGEYAPHSIGGIRFKNTYRGVEVSNHVYGIAVDIEPDRNSCCGCVAPWPNHPLCKAKNKTVWERMAMPKSWVDVFERYGFYWLGHDVLQDTMHFEFLGDPDKVLEPTSAVATTP